MLQTGNRNLQILYSLAFLALGFTLYNVYLEYTFPFAEYDIPYYDELSRVRRNQLLVNLLLIFGFLLPGIYMAYRNEKFRKLFPALGVLYLFFLNVMVI
jgi:hypothetical protein